MRGGALYLVPTLLGQAPVEHTLPTAVLQCVRGLDAFIAESAKSARHFLKAAGYPRPLAQVSISELNEHTSHDALPALLEPVASGRRVGLMSEAGCPAIADPGASLVALAHERGIRVVPLVGPSSLLLALMASGLEGQRFCFHGYLPVERTAREEAIRQLESDSRRARQTQLVIETPYRNERLFRSLLEICHPSTRLCLATDLTLTNESISTRTIGQWRLVPPPNIDKHPTVFLLLAAS
ncbi:MAG: SAM-dependent methyltransferase [Burkholderiales bacterium]|nr:SAM-dependent methyltransferase [Burkholderiales bacterium]